MAKRVSCGLDFVSPADITNALQIATESKYYFYSPNKFHKKMPQSLVANSVILLISSGMISLHCQSLIRDTKEISPEILKLDVSQLSLELISF
jgi:hypothetical protein